MLWIYVTAWACENRACGHMIFAYFFSHFEIITPYHMQHGTGTDPEKYIKGGG